MNYTTKIHRALVCSGLFVCSMQAMETALQPQTCPLTAPSQEPNLLKDQTRLALCLLKKTNQLPACPEGLQEQEYATCPPPENVVLHCLAHRNFLHDQFCYGVVDLAADQKKDLKAFAHNTDVQSSLKTYLASYECTSNLLAKVIFEGVLQPNPREAVALKQTIVLDEAAFRNALTNLKVAPNPSENDPLQALASLNKFDCSTMKSLCPAQHHGWSKKPKNIKAKPTLNEKSMEDSIEIIWGDDDGQTPLTCSIEALLDSPQLGPTAMDEFTNTDPQILKAYLDAWRKRTAIFNQFTQ